MRKFFRAFALMLGVGLTVGFGSCKVEEAETEYVTNEVEKTYASAVTFVVSETNTEGTLSLTMATATEGAVIYYTADGSTPTAGSSKYTAALTVSADTTFKAIAVKTGMENSPLSTATVSIKEKKVNVEVDKKADETPTVATYTVTFDSDGGSEVASQTVESGKTATKPADPTKSGEKTSYVFLGWYNGDTAFDFASEIKGEITLKAKWIEGFAKVTGTTIKGDETWTPSSDVFVSGRSLTIADLYVSDHEVTRGEYKALMGTDPSRAAAYDKDGNKLTEDDVLNNPVDYVNWYGAIVYCNKLSIKEGLTPCYALFGATDPDGWGKQPLYSSSSVSAAWDYAVSCNFKANGYRLPTEAEWEWLARGGQNYIYAGSDSVGDVAWGTSNTNDTGTRAVKTKAANGYGLYDMSGNVWEWCWDWYGSGSISSSTGASGASSGSGRVIRGGSWKFTVDKFTNVYRSYMYPYCNGDYIGFRVVRNAQ